MDVISVKLISGDELLGRLNSESSWDNDHITLDKVIQVMVGPGQDGKPAMMFVPYMATNQDGSADIFKKHIMIRCTEINDVVEKEYLKQTTSIALV